MKYAHGTQREQTDYKSEKVRPLGKTVPLWGAVAPIQPWIFLLGTQVGLENFLRSWVFFFLDLPCLQPLYLFAFSTEHGKMFCTE